MLGAPAGAGGCTPFLIPVEPSEPFPGQEEAGKRGVASAVGVEVAQVQLGGEILSKGVDENTLVGVTLRVTNRGPNAYALRVAETKLLLRLDATHAEATRAFVPLAAGQGPLPDDLVVTPVLPSVEVAPGHAETLWIVFHGYAFEGSEVSRRVEVTLPPAKAGEAALVAVLADPARGKLRWKLPARDSQMMIGFQNIQGLSGKFQGVGPATAFSRFQRVGRWWWEVGLVSGLAVQQEGELKSATSAFSTLGLTAHVTAPLLSWGGDRGPRRLGLFAGGTAATWIELMRPADVDAGKRPNVYGVYSAEAGLELAIGASPSPPTPFPLAAREAMGLPHLLIRLGYAQSWLDGGTSGALMSGFRVAF